MKWLSKEVKIAGLLAAALSVSACTTGVTVTYGGSFKQMTELKGEKLHGFSQYNKENCMNWRSRPHESNTQSSETAVFNKSDNLEVTNFSEFQINKPYTPKTYGKKIGCHEFVRVEGEPTYEKERITIGYRMAGDCAGMNVNVRETQCSYLNGQEPQEKFGLGIPASVKVDGTWTQTHVIPKVIKETTLDHDGQAVTEYGNDPVPPGSMNVERTYSITIQPPFGSTEKIDFPSQTESASYQAAFNKGVVKIMKK